MLFRLYGCDYPTKRDYWITSTAGRLTPLDYADSRENLFRERTECGERILYNESAFTF